jgi:predicted dehydrogenase
VICEKPFTSNQGLAREMWDRANNSGLTCMIAHEFRFASARMRAKELIDEGYIGEPKLAIMRLITPPAKRPAAPAQPGAPARAGNGFLWSLGSHYIDCLRHWFGEVESVSGDVANLRQGSSDIAYDSDDTFLFTLRFANGCIAHMVASRGLPFGSGPGVEVYGSEGALFTPQGPDVPGGGSGVNPPAHGKLLGGRVGEDEQLKELEIPERLQPFADERDDRLMPFRLLVREFVRGVDQGISPAPNFYDGWRCQQVLDAVRESSQTGKRIAITPAE